MSPDKDREESSGSASSVTRGTGAVMCARRTLALALAVVVPACTLMKVGTSRTAIVTLEVSGRSNQNVSVAARDAMVAVAWTASGDAGGDLFASVSTDGGTVFSEPVRVNDIAEDVNTSGEQPARLAIGADAIHVVWPSKQGGAAIRYARSLDGGRTFSPAVSVSPSGVHGARGWESLALAPDGAVHVAWLDGRAAAGAAAQPDAAESAHHAHVHGGAMADVRQDIYHAIVNAGVAPANGAIAVDETPIASNVCFCCKTALAISDRGVFAAWRHIYPGNLRDIAFARAGNSGRFSDPVRVSSDGWQIEGCPDDGPAMTVDAAGALRLVWPTLVPGATPRKGIFYARSTDGASFSPRVRVDSGARDPAHPQIASSGTGAAVVWDEIGNGERHIVMRRIDESGTMGGDETVSDERSASYPAIASGPNGLIVAWTSAGADRSVIHLRRIDR